MVREAGDFQTCLFDFIYPHNSYLFSGTPPIYVSADKNKNNNPVLLWNKHLPTVILRTHASKPVSNRQTKIICKQTLLIFLFVLYKLKNTCK